MSQFVVTIESGALVRGDLVVPADKILDLYKNAIIAEMHPTVKAAVSLYTKVGAQPAGKRAFVEVKLGAPVRSMGFGAVINHALSYMFELKDAVEQVIANFEPPDGAWVDQQSSPRITGDTIMTETDGAAAVGTASATAPPKLNAEDHAVQVGAAMQAAHYPEFAQFLADGGTPESGSVGSTYLQDAKAFIAAFNAAVDIMSKLQGVFHPIASSEPLPEVSMPKPTSQQEPQVQVYPAGPQSATGL